MDNNVMSHLGYQGTVEVSIDDEVMHGKILHINDLVTYEADSVQNLKSEFIAAVEDYLEFCKSQGVEPDKPFSGVFQVRVGAQLHKGVVKRATQEGKSINEVVREALDRHLNGRHQVVHHREIIHHHYPAQADYAGEYVLHEATRHRPKLRVVGATP